jgi:hypothetical protein
VIIPEAKGYLAGATYHRSAPTAGGGPGEARFFITLPAVPPPGDRARPGDG